MNKEMTTQARPVEMASTSAGATCSVEICLLGGFRLHTWPSLNLPQVGPKTEALLASLALAGDRGAVREALLEQIWPDKDAQLARQSLNSLVHGVRQMLSSHLRGADPVLHLGGIYRLNIEAGIGVDVHRFEELADAADRQLRMGDDAAAARIYTQAVEMYRGDLGVVTDVRGVVERERLRSRYLQLLAHLAEYAFAHHDRTTTLTHALKVLEVDPCREDAHRLAMRCYVRLGQRAQALRQYRLCEAIVRREFETAPEPATTLLFEQVRRDPQSV